MHDFNTWHHLFIYNEKLISSFVSIWNKDKNTLTGVSDDTDDLQWDFPDLSFTPLGPDFLSISFSRRENNGKQAKAILTMKSYANDIISSCLSPAVN